MGLRQDIEDLLRIFLELNDTPANPQARDSMDRLLGDVTTSMDELQNADLTSLDNDYLTEVFHNV